MSKGEIKTFKIIKPIWENGNISDWVLVALVTASDKTDALRMGRDKYGMDVDVRESCRSLKEIASGVR